VLSGSDKLNVICVYWGDKFSPDYVQKLYYMVKRNLTIPHRFIVLTDHVKLPKLVNCPGATFESLPENNLQGWWNKLLMFHPYFAPMVGTYLYFDLDVVILDNIDKFVQDGDKHDFRICRDFGQPTNMYNSSIMRWHTKSNATIWEGYKADKTRFDRLQGDQNVITEIMQDRPELNPFPDEWSFSYKWRNRTNPVFKRDDWTFERVKDASVAVFHGNPKPHESDQQWVIDNWQ
jgi:hypothetical protein|tara:strand:+ start:84 stop:782 length:699 start_codon:yes stop_codon:yes gene_type:complete